MKQAQDGSPSRIVLRKGDPVLAHGITSKGRLATMRTGGLNPPHRPWRSHSFQRDLAAMETQQLGGFRLWHWDAQEAWGALRGRGTCGWHHVYSD